MIGFKYGNMSDNIVQQKDQESSQPELSEYHRAVLQVLQEFFVEELKGFLFTRERLCEKLEAARTLYGQKKGSA